MKFSLGVGLLDPPPCTHNHDAIHLSNLKRTHWLGVPHPDLQLLDCFNPVNDLADNEMKAERGVSIDRLPMFDQLPIC